MADPLALVTGARGLIGSHVVRAAGQFAPRWHVVGLTRDRADLSDFAAIRRLWHDLAPRLVIHCAALSKPQQCARDPGLARRLNVEVTALLADLAADSRLVLLSTDHVFDGRAGWYDEAAPANPVTVYAETKVAAERIALANPRHLVIRTSLNAGTSPTGDRAFNEEMRRAWEEGRTCALFTDEFRCPIPAAVTARAVWERAAGVFHIAGAERLSRWHIGCLLAAHWPHLHARMEPSSIREFRDFPRQPDLSLSCAKAQARLSFPLPAFSAWLRANPNALG